jgi:formylglycine-generating enzyme required for sulfatase activity
MRTRNRSAIIAALLGACFLLASGGDAAETVYEKQGDWAQTMLATRAAVLANPMDPRSVETEVLVAGQPGAELSVDVSGWSELWLCATRRDTVSVWGNAVLIDDRGRKTRLDSLKPFDAVAEGTIYKDKLDKKNKLQIGGKRFSHALGADGISRIGYRLDSKYVRFMCLAGVTDQRRKRETQMIVCPSKPPVIAVWDGLTKDFRRQMATFAEDARTPLDWFQISDSKDSSIERRVAQRRIGRCAEFGADLKQTLTALTRAKTPARDAAWLTLYDEAYRLSGRAERVFRILEQIRQLGDSGDALQARYSQMLAPPIPPADARWSLLAEDTNRLAEALHAARFFHPEALRRAIDDLELSHPDEYTRADEFRRRLGDIEQALQAAPMTEQLAVEALTLHREALLANPAMDFEQLVLRKAKNAGLMSNWLSSCSRAKTDYGNQIMVLSPPRPDTEPQTLVEAPQDSFIGDIDLHWDADRMLVTALGSNDRWQVFEVNTDGTGMHQVTPGQETDVDNAEGCYVPDGSVIFSSTASMLGVPCVGGKKEVANLYRLDSDGETIRQLTFEQDQDWCPTVLHNGRIMYLRWEYTDAAHYFTRILMTMNPDGTNQMSHYGSNSYWPNSTFFARPVPDHPSRFYGIVTGHHGEARMGELILFDTEMGRHEGDGVVQRLPGYGEKVVPEIVDRLVSDSWPRFLHPWPLSQNYVLVSCRPDKESPWGIYLVDVFDNMLLLCEDSSAGCYEPIPLVSRPEPPVVPSRVDLDRKDAVVYMQDIYQGPGLKGVPRGTVERLRVFGYTYSYRQIGGHEEMGLESSWDSKRIMGTVPVNSDGSALFHIPANTPVAIQPLDSEGRALQLMRSWMVAMPGEVLSCAGCHEHNSSVPLLKNSLASSQRPEEIEPWYGPTRAFGFEREVQPVLDRYCTACHDGSQTDRPNFADRSKGPKGLSNAYHALHGYVRRPGPESDNHLLPPLEYHTSTSELFQILESGHYNVQLDREARERLYAWADLNVPYFATWTEVALNRTPEGTLRDGSNIHDISKRYNEMRLRYAGCYEQPEADTNAIVEKRPDPIRPEPLDTSWPPRPDVDNWPFDADQAVAMQAAAGSEVARTLDLGDGHSLTMVRIPTGRFVMGDDCGDDNERPASEVVIQRPFWMARTEVTNALYNRFDPTHDSRYIDQQWKDHTTPGYAANEPNQPVIRVSWQEAMAFCRKLSEATGRHFTLPSESQWEWACRAGSEQPFSFGTTDSDFAPFANLADESLRQFVVKGVNPKPTAHADWQAFIPRAAGIDDGRMISTDVGSFAANAWGLHDMHGNVSEWTLSDYRSYPYDVDDGRNAGDTEADKVVRGGSWRDRPHRARSGFRLSYSSWQKVFNVGFRVVCLD